MNIVRVTPTPTTATSPLLHDLALTREHERGYAALAVLLLRENSISDTDIARYYTLPSPRADRAMEAAYFHETGRHIEAVNVKARMRELICH